MNTIYVIEACHSYDYVTTSSVVWVGTDKAEAQARMDNGEPYKADVSEYEGQQWDYCTIWEGGKAVGYSYAGQPIP